MKYFRGFDILDLAVANDVLQKAALVSWKMRNRPRRDSTAISQGEPQGKARSKAAH